MVFITGSIAGIAVWIAGIGGARMTKADCVTYLVLGKVLLQMVEDGAPDDQRNYVDSIIEAIDYATAHLLLDDMVDRANIKAKREEDEDDG